jgi:hypothetical protein
MTQPSRRSADWVGDEALMAALRDALADPAVDPDESTQEPGTDAQDIDGATIDRMYAAARAAFTWRTIDEELELLSASDESAADLAMVRGSEEPVSRTLEFAGRIISIELEIGPELIVGQIYPVQTGQLTLLTPTGIVGELTSDEVGCFTFNRPADGPFRLRCSTTDAGVITDWICMT